MLTVESRPILHRLHHRPLKTALYRPLHYSQTRRDRLKYCCTERRPLKTDLFIVFFIKRYFLALITCHTISPLKETGAELLRAYLLNHIDNLRVDVYVFSNKVDSSASTQYTYQQSRNAIGKRKLL